jgi:hypothetical protein
MTRHQSLPRCWTTILFLRSFIISSFYTATTIALYYINSLPPQLVLFNRHERFASRTAGCPHSFITAEAIHACSTIGNASIVNSL